jgi:hypothetical protein
MSDPKQAAGDLAYVRAKLERAEQHDAPAMIYFLWAVIVLVGFAIVDFAAQYTAWFWMIAGPVGGITSFVLGWRHAVDRGAVSRDKALRHGLHWGGLLVAVIALLPLLVTGRIAPESFPQIVLLLIVMSYFYAGVHLDRALIWVAIALSIGFLVVVFVAGPVWTAVGALIAASLGAVGFTRVRAARAFAK